MPCAARFLSWRICGLATLNHSLVCIYKSDDSVNWFPMHTTNANPAGSHAILAIEGYAHICRKKLILHPQMGSLNTGDERHLSYQAYTCRLLVTDGNRYPNQPRIVAGPVRDGGMWGLLMVRACLPEWPILEGVGTK